MRQSVVKKLRQIARKDEREFYRRFWQIVGKAPFQKRLWLAWNILWHSQKQAIITAYRQEGEGNGRK